MIQDVLNPDDAMMWHEFVHALIRIALELSPNERPLLESLKQFCDARLALCTAFTVDGCNRSLAWRYAAVLRHKRSQLASLFAMLATPPPTADRHKQPRSCGEGRYRIELKGFMDLCTERGLVTKRLSFRLVQALAY